MTMKATRGSRARKASAVRVKSRQKLFLFASGDWRHSANKVCWPEQLKLEQQFTRAAAEVGLDVVRAHQFKPDVGHGLIANQAEGMQVLSAIPDGALVAGVEAVWQYSDNVIQGLMSLARRGAKILVGANWDGTWPGLVGASNMDATMWKYGVPHAKIWDRNLCSAKAKQRLREWLETGQIRYYPGPMARIDEIQTRDDHAIRTGEALGAELQRNGRIIGIFDEGCMGMENGVFSDYALRASGIAKQRLTQSMLYAETLRVTDAEAQEVYRWLLRKGMKFHIGTDEETELTEAQILLQCKMYIAVVRLADDFGCYGIGIQYQQGLKDLLPASDLVEGILNSTDRPPVWSRDHSRILYPDQAIPHANEVDQGAFVDGLMIKMVHEALGQPTASTQQDVRWGDWDQTGTVEDFVWVYLLSGSNPADHFIGGWRGAEGLRQPGMYFPLGGSTMRGICKPGEIIWSRTFEVQGQLCLHIGRGKVVKLPAEETERRWQATTPQWPIAHVVKYGLGDDEEQFFAEHKSNHAMQAYCTSSAAADRALLTRAYMARRLGWKVIIRGTKKDGSNW
jgi:hypothetical protein